MKIKRISREEIDKSKWNSCVHYANNGNVCGYVWYLDALTKDWEALIEEDYGSVFPLIWKKNWLGKKKIYQPELIIEGSLYSENILSATRIQHFFNAIPSEYKSLKLTISNQAKIPNDLGLKVEKLRDFYKTHAKNYKKENYFAYLRIMYNAMHRGWGFANGITNKKGELLAVNFFIYSHGKIMVLLPSTSKAGKAAGAAELLLSMLLQTHANKPVYLDFNGFEDIGVGSQEQVYYQVSK